MKFLPLSPWPINMSGPIVFVQLSHEPPQQDPVLFPTLRSNAPVAQVGESAGRGYKSYNLQCAAILYSDGRF